MSERSALIHLDLTQHSPTYEQIAVKIDEEMTRVENDRDRWKALAKRMVAVLKPLSVQYLARTNATANILSAIPRDQDLIDEANLALAAFDAEKEKHER